MDYSIKLSADRLAQYPFDSHWVVATRRSRNQPTDRLTVSSLGASFSFPPFNFEWAIDSLGSIVCDLSTTNLTNCGLQPVGSPACTATLATFFRIAREPQYIIQNELAPVILITVLSASAYWNDADSYADRLGIMATSLLSMMALQARAPQHNGSGLRVARAPG